MPRKRPIKLRVFPTKPPREVCFSEPKPRPNHEKPTCAVVLPPGELSRSNFGGLHWENVSISTRGIQACRPERCIICSSRDVLTPAFISTATSPIANKYLLLQPTFAPNIIPKTKESNSLLSRRLRGRPGRPSHFSCGRIVLECPSVAQRDSFPCISMFHSCFIPCRGIYSAPAALRTRGRRILIATECGLGAAPRTCRSKEDEYQ